METDRRFRAEHAETDTAGLATTLAKATLESAAIAGTTGIASFDDDVASGVARFSVEPGGITEGGLANRSRILPPILCAFHHWQIKLCNCCHSLGAIRMSLEKRFPVKEKGKVSKKVYLCIILKMCLRMIFLHLGHSEYLLEHIQLFEKLSQEVSNDLCDFAR